MERNNRKLSINLKTNIFLKASERIPPHILVNRRENTFYIPVKTFQRTCEKVLKASVQSSLDCTSRSRDRFTPV